MKLQMLGTGGAFAKTYFNNNALLDSGSGKLLIDFGITAPQAMHQLQIPLTEPDAVLITHIHGDHVGGLEELGFRMNIVHGRKPILYIAESLVQPLWEHTLRGGMHQDGYIERITDVFDVRPLTPGSQAELVPGISVELISTRHIPGKDSYSLLINEEIFYSADMTFHPELLERLVRQQGYRLILHEVQLIGHGAVHTTLDELRSLPEDIQEKIYLMHYDDSMEQFRNQAGVMRFLEQHRIYDTDDMIR